jgi:ribose 5-phosphate isomerase B
MIAIAADSAGFGLKKEIMAYIEKSGLAYKDFGAFNDSPSDYPLYARFVCDAILRGECERGILVCGTGNGIAMAANRNAGIRAAICHDVFSAKAARSHNDANIIALGARVVGAGTALEAVGAFLDTGFSGEERHQRRVNMIEGRT